MIKLMNTSKSAAALLSLGLVVLATGCSSPAPQPLANTFDAHGGLANWNSQKAFRYRMNGFPLSAQVAKPNETTVDLHKRLHRVEGATFLAGYDGQNGWALPTDDAAVVPAYRRMPVALAILGVMVLLSVFDIVPLVAAVIMAALAAVFTGRPSTAASYRAIHWNSIVLVAGM